MDEVNPGDLRKPKTWSSEDSTLEDKWVKKPEHAMIRTARIRRSREMTLSLQKKNCKWDWTCGHQMWLFAGTGQWMDDENPRHLMSHLKIPACTITSVFSEHIKSMLSTPTWIQLPCLHVLLSKKDRTCEYGKSRLRSWPSPKSWILLLIRKAGAAYA